jgi:hypothetical protein
MKIFFAIVFACAAFAAQGSDSFHGAVHAAPPTHSALYSFADVYRLAVSGSTPGGPPLLGGTDSPVRVALTQAAIAPEPQYSVIRIPEPGRWVLLLSGLALALWVARRRLGYYF